MRVVGEGGVDVQRHPTTGACASTSPSLVRDQEVQGEGRDGPTHPQPSSGEHRATTRHPAGRAARLTGHRPSRSRASAASRTPSTKHQPVLRRVADVEPATIRRRGSFGLSPLGVEPHHRLSDQPLDLRPRHPTPHHRHHRPQQRGDGPRTPLHPTVSDIVTSATRSARRRHRTRTHRCTAAEPPRARQHPTTTPAPIRRTAQHRDQLHQRELRHQRATIARDRDTRVEEPLTQRRGTLRRSHGVVPAHATMACHSRTRRSWRAVTQSPISDDSRTAVDDEEAGLRSMPQFSARTTGSPNR